jgi:hypothetical protein
MISNSYIFYISNKKAKPVANNREIVCIFVRNFVSNAKGKTRKVIVVSILVGSVWFSSTPKNIPPQQEFLSSYSSVISNQRKNNIKKYFIQLVHLFKEHDLIEDNYKIISNGHYYFTKEFNTHDISEGFVIYEKLSI